MSVRIRFRSDNWWIANRRAIGEQWSEHDGISKEEFEAYPPAQPGDIWRSHWASSEVTNIDGRPCLGPLAGYTICCPKCKEVHTWTTATNCSFQPTQHSFEKADGTKGTYSVCGHSGNGSCWDWTGSPEDSTLSASPSLLCHTCGFHGWLRSGELSEC